MVKAAVKSVKIVHDKVDKVYQGGGVVCSVSRQQLNLVQGRRERWKRWRTWRRRVERGSIHGPMKSQTSAGASSVMHEVTVAAAIRVLITKTEAPRGTCTVTVQKYAAI